MSNSTALRAKRFKAKQAEAGLVQANVWVPADCLADLRLLAERLCAERGLTVGPLRDPATGRLVSLHG